MTLILLKDFCLTGHFGDVRIGMNISEVKEILGEPDHEQDFETGSSGIMYAWYEFFYWTDTKILYAIQNDHLMPWPGLEEHERAEVHGKDIEFDNSHFKVETWFLSAGKAITYRDIVEICRRDNVNIIEKCNEWGDSSIEFESGVKLDFDDMSDWVITDKNGQRIENKSIIKSKEDYLLNGMRLFQL